MSSTAPAMADGPGNGRAGDAPGAARGGPGLRLRRNPLRLLVSAGLWSAAWYLLSYLAVGSVLFTVGFTAAVVAAALTITLAGLPLLVAAAGVLRGCANVERGRLRFVVARPVRGGYRPVTEPGIMAQVRTRWRDAATWRDVAYIIGLWAPLFALDLAVMAVWLVFLAGITMPLWYWSVPQTFPGGIQAHGLQFGYFPHGPDGQGAYGLFVDTLPKALLGAAICAVLFLIFNYVVVATARAHSAAARALLRPPADPLAGARDVLARPGPLRPQMPNGTTQVHRQA
jgi:Putative sensor